MAELIIENIKPSLLAQLEEGAASHNQSVAGWAQTLLMKAVLGQGYQSMGNGDPEHSGKALFSDYAATSDNVPTDVMRGRSPQPFWDPLS